MSRAGLCLAAIALAALGACGRLPIVDLPAANQSSRVDHLVIHFTGENFAESTRLLAQRTVPPVSAHYLVPAHGDPTYPHRRVRVYRLVEEQQRAWHAGQSYWNGLVSLNARSIGIEIVNESRCAESSSVDGNRAPENQDCAFVPYGREQIELVVELARQILARHPTIDPVAVVGHADIAPDRRVDPGPTFPWHTLYEHGIGAWPDEEAVLKYLERFAARPPTLMLLQRALVAYGYRLEASGNADPQTRFVVRAFQMHYRPADWSGQPDPETAAVLFALLEKYRPRALGALLAEYELLPG